MRSSRTSPLNFMVEDERWRKNAAVLKLIRRAARAAARARSAPGASKRAPPRSAITVLLAADARLRVLNRQFRRKNKATNVLSFAARDPHYLGDIAIAFGTTAREAKSQGKSLANHAAHLVVHGILHLKGFDHKRNADAKAMETLETLILSRLGIPDPYRPRPYTTGFGQA
jgi:probable rRNA maturation factor